MSVSKQQLFRELPSQELINSILQSCGFSGLDDSREFQKADLSMAVSQIDDWISLLERCYYPCKAQLYIKKQQTPDSLLVILRQLLRLEGYKLCGTEKQRQTIYSIQKDIYHPIWKSNTYELDFT